jgi:hypothetical protein
MNRPEQSLFSPRTIGQIIFHPGLNQRLSDHSQPLFNFCFVKDSFQTTVYEKGAVPYFYETAP